MAGSPLDNGAMGLAVPALCAALLLAGAATFATGADARPRCAGKKATHVGSKGRDRIVTKKKGKQVIVARGGNDVIIAKRNRDVICSGAGNDRIFAGPGRDRAFGGPGNDLIVMGESRDKGRGGGGADTMIGSGGADRLRGGPGQDRIFGGIQDDRLYGNGGGDLLAGGHGIDRLIGGGGNDWLRGDVNRDRYRGGAGSDTLSFATATPPGPFKMGGVDVTLRRGRATGDDSPEGISRIENLVGSPFQDRLVGKGGGFVRGILGNDSCSGFAVADCANRDQGRGVAMVSDRNSLDPGLIVMGGPALDTLAVTRSGSAYRISGSPLDAGPGCGRVAGGDLVCSAPRVLGYLLVWGGDNGDRLSARGLPAASFVKLDGGLGNDVLAGSRGSDLLYAGEGGADVLLGRGGDDALVSRPGGRDRLFGGRGNDQLVTNDPCGGHRYSGGRGKADVAGFGHTISRGVRAKIGGKARLRGSGRGCRPTRIRGDSEVLEGTRLADILIASNRGDLLIGRNGNDRCVGGRHKRC